MTGWISWTCWNVLLATVPVALAYLMAYASDRLPPRRPLGATVLVAVGLTWLTFLPNTCYLLTEWRHFLFDEPFVRARDRTEPGSLSVLRVVAHFAFFAGYSGFGAVSFALALRPVERLVRRHGMRPARWAPPLFVAVSLGVYLGLIVRLNSWDLVTRPSRVLGVAADAVANGTLLAVIVAFGGALLGAV